MEFELFFNKLLKIYNAKTITDLSEKLNLNRSTVAGWKNRETYAPILEHLFLNDLENLKSILGFNETNNFQNSNNKVSGFSALIDNSSNKSNTSNNDRKEENINIPQSITIELSSLFERLKDKDEKFIKNITYKIEDFISDIKKETRD